MLTFFRTVLRDKWKIWVVYMLSTVACLETYVAIYPSLASQADSFSSMLQILPSQFYTVFNMTASMFSFHSLSSFLSAEYMSLLWPVMVILLAIPIANYIVANDVDNGTIETILALPASRLRIFAERYLAGFVMLEAFTALTVLMAIPLASFHGITLSNSNCWTAFWDSALFTWLVYSLAVLASTVSSEKHQASMISGSVLVIMYVFNMLAGLTKNLDGLKWFSFFHYFDGGKAFADNALTSGSVTVMLICSVVFTALAILWFKRRDLSV